MTTLLFDDSLIIVFVSIFYDRRERFIFYFVEDYVEAQILGGTYDM